MWGVAGTGVRCCGGVWERKKKVRIEKKREKWGGHTKMAHTGTGNAGVRCDEGPEGMGVEWHVTVERCCQRRNKKRLKRK